MEKFWLPAGRTPHDHPAADGQLGGILKLWRDYTICGDRSWLKALVPAAQTSLDYCIETWGPDQRGARFEPHHNTYDIEFWRLDGRCGSIYVAVLCAMVLMLREVGRGG